MKIRFLLLIVFFIGLSLNSFSQHFHLTKRQYRKGFYFSNREKARAQDTLQIESTLPAKEKILVSDDNFNQKKDDKIEKVSPRFFDNLIASIDSNLIFLAAQKKVSDSTTATTEDVVPTKSIKQLQKLKARINKFQQMLGKNSEETLNWSALGGLVLAIASLVVFGMLGLFFVGSVIAIIMGLIISVISFVLSIVANNEIIDEPDKYKGRGLAIAGIVLGIFEILGWVLLLCLLI